MPRIRTKTNKKKGGYYVDTKYLMHKHRIIALSFPPPDARLDAVRAALTSKTLTMCPFSIVATSNEKGSASSLTLSGLAKQTKNVEKRARAGCCPGITRLPGGALHESQVLLSCGENAIGVAILVTESSENISDRPFPSGRVVGCRLRRKAGTCPQAIRGAGITNMRMTMSSCKINKKERKKNGSK